MSKISSDEFVIGALIILAIIACIIAYFSEKRKNKTAFGAAASIGLISVGWLIGAVFDIGKIRIADEAQPAGDLSAFIAKRGPLWQFRIAIRIYATLCHFGSWSSQIRGDGKL